MNVLIGCEESQAVCKALREKGHNAYSCDLQECSGGSPEFHIIADVLTVIRGGEFTTQSGTKIFIESWDLGIFFPDCTFLTCSAEWAYKEPPYHQKVKPGTLTGKKRKEARKEAINFATYLYNQEYIKKVAIENPVGILQKHSENQTK